MKWISFKDRLPPQDGTAFLCYDPFSTDTSKIYVIVYDKGVVYTGDLARCSRDACYREACGEGWFTWNPSHWMPLPEPPKE